MLRKISKAKQIKETARATTLNKAVADSSPGFDNLRDPQPQVQPLHTRTCPPETEANLRLFVLFHLETQLAQSAFTRYAISENVEIDVQRSKRLLRSSSTPHSGSNVFVRRVTPDCSHDFEIGIAVHYRDAAFARHGETELLVPHVQAL